MPYRKKPMDLTVGNIWRQLTVFAMPILMCNLFQQLYNTVDAAVVGAFAGSDALAAVGSVGSLFNLIVGFFMGLSTGVGIVVSRFYGARDDNNVSRSVHTAFALAIVSGAFVSVLGIFATPTLLRLMKSPDNVIGMSIVYLRILFYGMIPSMVYNVGAGILRAIGDSRNPLIYLIIGGCTNVVLNVIFVAGFGMDADGVAYATIISQMLTAVLVVIKLMRETESYRLVPKLIRFHGTILVSIIKIGVPAGLSSMMYALSNTLIQTNINIFGSDAMAGTTAFGKIDGFLYMPLNAFGLATTTFVGQNMGAGHFDRVKKGALAGTILAFSVAAAGAFIVFAVTKPLLVYFTKQNMTAVEYGLQMMYFLAPTYCLFAPTEVLSGAVRGAGAAIQSTVMTALCICVLRVALILTLMPVFNDIRLVFAAYPISWVVSSITFLLYFKFGHWMKKKI